MSGRVFLFGADIDTDQLAPGRYMKGGIEEVARHCLEDVRPDFAATVRPGDIVVGGRNFGMGSSREQAAEALKLLGVAAVVAPSFAGIFYRNAINLGLPVLVGHGLDVVADGDRADIDIAEGTFVLKDRNVTLQLEPIPANLMAIIEAGGLIASLRQRFASEGRSTPS